MFKTHWVQKSYHKHLNMNCGFIGIYCECLVDMNTQMEFLANKISKCTLAVKLYQVQNRMV